MPSYPARTATNSALQPIYALPGCSRPIAVPGNMLTAEAGATLRELMDRMGHSSTRAALVYLHATSQRQRTIADAVGAMTRAALREIDEHSSNPASGTDLARGHEFSL